MTDKEKLNKIRELAKDLQHGEDCFKSRGYKDEIRCRCSLPKLLELLNTCEKEPDCSWEDEWYDYYWIV